MQTLSLSGPLANLERSAFSPPPSLGGPIDGLTLSLRRVQHPIWQNLFGLESQVSIDLTSIRGLTYLVSVSIGDQPFEFLVDTGSSDLWVLSANCTSSECKGAPKYTDSTSLDLRDTPFDFSYLQGSVSGLVGSETVALGSYVVRDQILAFANETDGLGISATGNSGILGLAFDSTSGMPPGLGSTLLTNLFASLDDDRRYFALHLGRDKKDSSFSIGELDSTLANSTDAFTSSSVWIGPKSVPDYWKLPLRSISINGTAVFDSFAPSRVLDSPTPIAILDSGTTFILGPTSDVDAFWVTVGSSRKNSEGSWEVRCTRAVSVGFTLGDDRREYAVDPSDISWLPGSENGWCIGGVQANDNIHSGDWILGDSFLRNVYVLHHGGNWKTPPSIGLLNLTDCTAALARFQEIRGEDTESPILSGMHVSSPRASRTSLGSILACASVVLGSYFLGGVGGWVTQAYKGHAKKTGGVILYS